jgi:hypothetical protein
MTIGEMEAIVEDGIRSTAYASPQEAAEEIARRRYDPALSAILNSHQIDGMDTQVVSIQYDGERGYHLTTQTCHRLPTGPPRGSMHGKDESVRLPDQYATFDEAAIAAMAILPAGHVHVEYRIGPSRVSGDWGFTREPRQ